MITENFLLMNKSKVLEDLSKEYGFEKTLFLGEDFVLIKGGSKKEVLKKIKDTKKTINGKKKKLLIIYEADSEEMLRFVLEKTPIDIVKGMEAINPKDSVHFLRGGIDQVTCKIAQEEGKVLAFSFCDILNAKGEIRVRLLRRMMFNLKLCRKYKVKVLLTSFASSKEEMRPQKDLEAFLEILTTS